ncbi:hypothetical protein PMAYCL1PPCAC_06924 [Pristionchus mayeri]|uniref:Uncharacterized protein n=1 Tax=Pristionchus mayeri TaxID=1317129 RepID=A0AAN4ZB49_9BILA|nr:hypothetical protein PMAYCL1PPCAC_06924 [Pristionchus mayeri]
MGSGHQTVEIVERVRSSEEMGGSADLFILILIIGLLVAALAYLYNRNSQTEQALALSLKLQKEAAQKTDGKDGKGKDRVKEAKDVLALLEKYEKKKNEENTKSVRRRKTKSRTDEESSDASIEEKKKRKRGKDVFTFDELYGIDKKTASEFGKVMVAVNEAGSKIPWIEGKGKIVPLDSKMVKALLEATEKGLARPRSAPPFPPGYNAMAALKCTATVPDRKTMAKLHSKMTDAKKAAK